MNDTLNEVANFLNPPVEPASEFFTSADNDLKSKILTSWLQAQTNQPSSMIKVRNLCSNILHLNGSSLSTPLTLQSYAKICEILYKNKDLEKTLDGDFQNFKKIMREQQNRTNLDKHVFFKESKSNSLEIKRNALKNISSILSGAAAELEITPENLMALHLFDPFDSKATDLDLDQSLSTQDLEEKNQKRPFHHIIHQQCKFLQEKPFL